MLGDSRKICWEACLSPCWYKHGPKPHESSKTSKNSEFSTPLFLPVFHGISFTAYVGRPSAGGGLLRPKFGKSGCYAPCKRIVFDNWFFVCILTGGGTYSRGGRGCDGRAEGTKTVGARPHFSVPERRAETASETAPSRHETGLGRIDLNSINHKLCFCSVQIACLSRHDPTTH